MQAILMSGRLQKQKNKQQKQNKKKALSSEFSNSIFIKFHFKVY